jgi:Fe(3+) dicitrate transport protein
MSRHPFGLIGLLLSSVAALPALAQSAPTEQSAGAVSEVAEIVVVGGRQGLSRIPGSASVVDAEDLRRSQIFTVNDALRKVPGLFPREEEGGGLRPNVGVRGLNPTRSTKTLFLEDGLPLAFAPYGDNATYFHPSVTQYQRIEVLKGSGQIAFGPNTVGGIINYITPNPPTQPGGTIMLRAGNRHFYEAEASVGGTVGETGLLFTGQRRETDGTRRNIRLRTNDASVKIVRPLTEGQSLMAKLSWHDEDSDVPYSGLTRAEYAADPRANPFTNDEFRTRRAGASLVHKAALNDNDDVTTALYGTWFDRDWWRQSSNSAQRPNDSSDPRCAGMANLNTTCGNEGRLRTYYTYGLDSRLTLRRDLGALDSETTIGLRAHGEEQERRQVNGDTPTARTAGSSVNGGLREDNRREVAAYSGFIQNRFGMGAFAVTPGLRVENINYDRLNRLNNSQGESDLTAWIPGIGVSYTGFADTTVFAGMHRGFAPPRVEDIISTTGGSVDLDAEKSWSYELGLRGQMQPGVTLEASLFRMDFDNQIVPSSVAGGAGATLTSAGKTLHQGLEASVQLNSRELLSSTQPYGFTLSAAWTWVANAEYRGTRFSSISGFTNLSVRGNRLPYAPENIATLGLGFNHDAGFDGLVEWVHTGSMFTDDINSVSVSANGQQGRIGQANIFNLSFSQKISDSGVTALFTVKNLLDRTYVVDRSRGTIPGAPRLIQAGVRYSF